MDGVVAIADREFDPVDPFDRHHGLAVDIETGGGVGGLHAEGFGGRFGADGLPVPVEDQNGVLMEQRVHGGGRLEMAILRGAAPRLTGSKPAVLLIH